MTNEIEVKKVSHDIAKDSCELAEKSLLYARSLIIKNDNDYLIAAEDVKSDKYLLKKIEDEEKKGTAPLYEVMKTIRSWFKPAKDNIEKSISIKSSAMMKYSQKKEELARIENARLQDLANKQAEKLAEQARKALEKGNEAKAQELMAQAQMKQVIVPTVQAEAPKIAGLTTRDNWTFEVIDINLVPRDYLCADDKKIGQVVRATKGSLNIPGVRIYKETKMAGSR